ncbi:polysaccharide biosynthesis protein [Mucilaginibacter conchicola]|uniref:Polysaccharide biosynthesis protein n=1 Tax=Mucilaginibacter conchicola TaxID=2303333 RepID=A0A372NUC7_9SPHI|nr:oligosaccharide flippase family protein [Mucilaginibacter conchicola]RFZ92815.1 polysaccharide biosynthesis protein [Mucilaginibacter conchicola]
MLQTIQTGFRSFFTKGHERSLRAKRNIFQSLLIKTGGVFCSFALIPLTIKYVGATNYGVWLTLSSIISWAALFDLGLGNGLKNKLAEDIALNNLDEGKTHISSTYAILTLISVILLTVFCFINPYINWHSILNVPANELTNLNHLVAVIFIFFCLQFIIQLINTVLTANQKPALPALLSVLGQAFTIISVLFLINFTASSLTYLVYVVTGIPLMVLLVASIWFYKGVYKPIAPGFKAVNAKYARQLISAGGAFFIIQIGTLVLYETDNIVITQLFSPKDVTTFNIAYKLFSVVLMFFVMIITPFWSAFTEAYVKRDYDWIKLTLNKMNKLWLGLSMCTVLLLVCSPIIYRLWLGEEMVVPFTLSLAMCGYTIALIWQAIYVQFLNGISKIRLQLYLSIFCALINIPLSIVMGRYWGLAGVTTSNTIIFLIMGVAFSLQTKRIINGTATGIYNM